MSSLSAELQHSSPNTHRTADFPKSASRSLLHSVEEIKPAPKAEPLPSAKVRVEDKLIQGRKATLRKIEELKKKQEEEMLQASPGRPQISKKTTDLAARAEERFFRKHSPPKARNSEDSGPDMVSRNSPKSAGLALSFARAQEVSSVRVSPKRGEQRALSAARSRPAPTPGSLYHLSSLERNQVWKHRLDTRLAEQRKLKAKEGLKECTFAPIMYSRVPQKLQRKSTDDLFTYSQSMPDQFDVEVYSADARKLSPVKSSEEQFSTWASPPKRSTFESDLHLFSFGESHNPQYRQLSPYKLPLQAFSPERFLQRLSKEAKPRD